MYVVTVKTFAAFRLNQTSTHHLLLTMKSIILTLTAVAFALGLSSCASTAKKSCCPSQCSSEVTCSK